MVLQQSCPCGTAATYDACCGRLHRGAAEATTAGELMRARYAAYAIGDPAYLFRSWHPGTRPDDLEPSPGMTWTGLDVLGTVAGGPEDEDGEVEFVARYRTTGGHGELHERSRFARRAGRWVYVDGDAEVPLR